MILITGASSGIGEATAYNFAELGFPLILVSRRKQRLLELKKEIQSKHRVAVHVFSVDVSKKSSIQNFYKKNQTLLKQVTVLVNNAGLALGTEKFQESSPQNWEVMLNTNLNGLAEITFQQLKHFTKKKQGHIINIGSVAGIHPYAGGNVYCASKAAVHSLSHCLRIDLLGTGVRVTEILPGMVETEFSFVRLKSWKKADSVYAGMKPLTPRDVSQTIVWAALQPKHVNIAELVIYPTDQAQPGSIYRK